MRRQRRQQRKTHQRFRRDRAVGADRKHRLAFAAPNGLDAELNSGGARCARGVERNRRALGTEMIGETLGDGAAFRRREHGRKLRLARGAHEVRIVGIALGGGGLVQRFAIMPLQFKRRRRDEQRARKMIFAADAGLSHRFFGGEECDARGEVGGRHVVRVGGVDRSRDGGPQAVDRKPRDAPDAGDALRSISTSCRPCRCRAT